MMIVTLDAKRRLIVPTTLAVVQPGDKFRAEFDEDEDTLIYRRIGARADWLTVLKNCPISMDDVPPRRRPTTGRVLPGSVGRWVAEMLGAP